MKRAKAPKPDKLPPKEQMGLYGEEQREVLGLPLFAGSPPRVMENAYTPRATHDPNAKQPGLF